APQESRVFPLNSRGAVGDNYTLAIYKRTGALILLKNATINRDAIAAPITPPPAPAIPAPAATAPAVAKGLTVKARLAPERISQSEGGEVTPPAVVRPIRPQRVEINPPAARQPNSAQVAEPEAPAPEQPGVAIAKVPTSARAGRRMQRRDKSQTAEQPVAPQGVDT